MKRELLVAEVLADALLSVEPGIAESIERVAWTLGRRHRWIAPFCTRLFHRFGSSLCQSDRRKLVDWIRSDAGYRNAWGAVRLPRIAHYPLDPPRMSPRHGALAACALPAIPTSRDLADWLGIGVSELDWFADLREMNPPEGALSHYRYEWVAKRFGARLIEIPKARLKEIQRRILHGILDPVPVHRAAHGFRKGHSCLTYVEPHVGREVVLRMDLRDFFPGIASARVSALFSTLGYPDNVARLLAGLCTNKVPMRVARRGASSWQEAKRLGVPHLPQGAPTSPALANLCALHLDQRLDALATSMDSNYTRYADDLAFSGPETLRRQVERLPLLVAEIALEEGFEVNHRKTRVMHASDRQILTGIVVNHRPNLCRTEFDRLKAILTNCARHGPEFQDRGHARNFRAYLAGRIAYVGSLNPDRATKLDSVFRSIAWPTSPE